MIPVSIKRCLQRRFPFQYSFLRARLATEGLFGLYFTVGAGVLAGAVWLFGGIAEDVVTGDPLVVWDALLSEWLRTHATPRFTRMMQTVSALADTTAVGLICIIMIALLMWQRLWYWLFALLLAVPGGILVNTLLKWLFSRQRPGWADAALTDAGFPSGHVMMATILAGFVSIYLFSLINSKPARFLIAVALIVLIVMVALSRLYLGAHFLSDVLAAIAAGCAWLVLCVTAVEAMRRYRA